MNPVSKKDLQQREEILCKPQLHAIILIKPVLFLLSFALLYSISRMSLTGDFDIPSIVAITGLFLVIGTFCIIGALGVVGISVVLTCFGSLGILVILAISSIVVAATALVVMLSVFYFSIIVSLAWFIVEVIRFSLEEYYITNKRLIFKQILRDGSVTSIKDIPIGKIESVHCDRGVFGSLLNYGTVSVAGIGGIIVKYYSIDKPNQIRRKICEIMEKNTAITVIKGKKNDKATLSDSLSGKRIPYGTFVSLNTDD